MQRLVAKADLSKSEKIQLEALKLIGKNMAMFTDKVEHTGKDRIIKIYIPDNKRDKSEKKKPAEAQSKIKNNKGGVSKPG